MHPILQPQPYRGRIAPSPTGLLHLGHASTFWIAHRRAADANGTLIFRNDDLDRDRCRPEFVNAAIEDLQWLGMRWQEGPDIGGPYAPYSQSQRLALYQSAFESLLASGFLYPCSCSRREVALAVSAPHSSNSQEIYPGTCRPSGPPPPWPQRAGINWRFKIAKTELLHFADLHFGVQNCIVGKDFGDFLIWRKDDLPSYQLATVVDDHLMGITEVVRGADLVESTFQQLLLYRALGVTPPSFFHCNLITDSSGKRLAKRHDALSLRHLRSTGIDPVALTLRIESGHPI